MGTGGFSTARLGRMRDVMAKSVGTYGWDGGLGTSWANDPTEDMVGIVLT